MMFSNGQLIGLVVVGLVGVVYISTRAKDAVVEVGNAVNPLNQDNVFYTGVNNVGAKITGDKDFNLGTVTYDATHTENNGHVLDPTNDENFFYSSVNALGERVSGEAGWTLGGAAYDFFNG